MHIYGLILWDVQVFVIPQAWTLPMYYYEDLCKYLFQLEQMEHQHKEKVELLYVYCRL